MKRLITVVSVALLCAVGVSAQTLSKEDLGFGVKHLEGTREEIVKVTEGLSEAQWHFKPAPDRWSVAECLEHIAVVEEFLFQMVNEQVMKAPTEARTAEEVKASDQKVLTLVADRSQRFQAPEPVRPAGRWATPEDTLKHFLESRARSLEYLKNTPDLRAHVAESPLGKLDAYQWLLYISSHSERHTKQIKEVMADANFPKE